MVKKINPIYTSWSRQVINTWLRYVLSQPVDIDVPVVMFFLRQYFSMAMLGNCIRVSALYLLTMTPLNKPKDSSDTVIQQTILHK